MRPINNDNSNENNNDDDDLGNINSINFNLMPQPFSPLLKPLTLTSTRKNNNNNNNILQQLPNSALSNILETLSILMNDSKGQKNSASKDTFG